MNMSEINGTKRGIDCVDKVEQQSDAKRVLTCYLQTGELRSILPFILFKIKRSKRIKLKLVCKAFKYAIETPMIIDETIDLQEMIIENEITNKQLEIEFLKRQYKMSLDEGTSYCEKSLREGYPAARILLERGLVKVGDLDWQRIVNTVCWANWKLSHKRKLISVITDYMPREKPFDVFGCFGWLIKTDDVGTAMEFPQIAKELAAVKVIANGPVKWGMWEGTTLRKHSESLLRQILRTGAHNMLRLLIEYRVIHINTPMDTSAFEYALENDYEATIELLFTHRMVKNDTLLHRSMQLAYDNKKQWFLDRVFRDQLLLQRAQSDMLNSYLCTNK